MPNSDLTKDELINELRQRVSQLEQLQIQYQQENLALRGRLEELTGSRLFKSNRGGEQTAFLNRGDQFDEFIVQLSDRTIEKETDHAPNADVAVALQKLQKEISERQQVEAALLETNQTLQAIIHASPLAIINLSNEGKLKMWSPAAEKIFGWTEKEVLGGPLPFIPEDKREEFQQLHQQKLQGNSLAGVELRRLRKSGEEIDIAIWGAPVYDTQGKVSATMAVIADISERKRTQKALSESESRFKRLFEANVIGIFFPDSSGVISEANDAFLRIVGYSKEDIYSGKVRWDTMTHPEYIHLDQQAIAEYKILGFCNPYEKLLIRKDGSFVPVLAGGAGDPGQGIAFVLDLSARKQAEATAQALSNQVQEQANTLQAILSTSVDHIYVIDREGRYRYISKNGAEVLGFQPDQVIGKTWQQLGLPAEVMEPVDAQRAKIISDGQPMRGESSYFTSTGIKHYEYILTPLRNSEQIVEAVVAVSRDVTERKQAETEREQLLVREQEARTLAESANRMKDEFLSILSHELRTPLNAILGWSRLLCTKPMDELARIKALQTIERNANAQAQLIEDILDVSGIITGKLRLKVCPVEISQIIRGAIDTIRPAAEAKGIQIQTNFSCATDIVSGDPDRLQQVVWNLLANAIKFTPAGGQVEITVASVQSDLEIMISDTGQGIHPEFLPFVFERFRQADSTTTRLHGGLGLGLAIVRHLIELHGGTVAVESPGLGLGATFIVKLPAIAFPQDTSTTQRTSRTRKNKSTLETAQTLTNIKILVVDDEPDACELLTTILEASGAQVTVASSALAAIELLEKLNPDILISDIGMPGEDGYALIRKIRAQASLSAQQIPAIALTAYARAEDRQQALQAGFQNHLPKPIEPQQLTDVVANLVKRKPQPD